MKTLIAIVAVCGCLGGLITSPQAGTVLIGQGASSCGRWTQVRRDPERGVEAIAMESWIQGFLAAEAMHLIKTHPDFLQDGDPDAYYSWVDNFCQRFPLDQIFTAAAMLTAKLATKNRQ